MIALKTLCPQRVIIKVNEDPLKYFWTKIYNLKTYSRDTFKKKCLCQNKNRFLKKSLLEKISNFKKYGKKTKNRL